MLVYYVILRSLNIPRRVNARDVRARKEACFYPFTSYISVMRSARK